LYSVHDSGNISLGQNEMQIKNKLAEIRRKRGISATVLAGRSDVRRQTIYAIEAGTYIPNTSVSLRLAQVLDVKVEDIFCFDEQPSPPQLIREVDFLSLGGILQPGQPVSLCRVGKRMVGVLSQPFAGFLPFADAVCAKNIGGQRATVHSFDEESFSGNRILIAGCDPTVPVLGRFMAKEGNFELIAANCSSMQAINWLIEGKVHVAGSHLCDPRTGESNLHVVRKCLPQGGYKIISFARWEQGLVVAKGNPKGIRSVPDLSRKNISFVNREKGSGSRLLLDEMLHKEGIKAAKVLGYHKIALGHIPAAWHVYSGQADCCLAAGIAARTFGLDFIPLRTERYDIIIRDRNFTLEPIQVLLDVINRSALQRELRALGGYDMTQTGQVRV
jgi:molybdate-binding protein/DNA-binding XRE family transcriptional regulator